MTEIVCRNLQTKGQNSIKEEINGDTREIKGYVVTEKGIVIVYSWWWWESSTKNGAKTTIKFVWEGRLRVLEKPFYCYPLSLARAARKFVDDVVKGNY